VRRAIALSVIRLIRHDSVMRLDADPEGVHQARVATRRLRSDLRTFGPLVEPEFASALRDELGWLAGILGDVRDGDVLLARLRRRTSDLPEVDRQAADAVLETLQADRDAAHATLLEALTSRRYVELLDRLVDAANDPTLRKEADEPAAVVVPGLVRRPWHKLAKRVKAVADTPSDEKLHAVRIRTKRVRYAAEAAAPIVGKQARTFAQAAADLQDVLGDLNDAVVAAAWLDAWATAHPRESTRGAEALAAIERAAAERLRGEWRPAWEKLESPKLRTWM
jgi:CHAD domain-containing protein